MALLPIVLGAAALYNAFGKKQPKAPSYQAPDLTGTLAAIDEYYKKAAETGKTSLGQELQGLNTMTAENLAGRGIYSSPVSQYAYQQNTQNYQKSLADMLGSLQGQQLQAKANITGQVATQGAANKYQSELAKYQQRLQSQNMLTGLLSQAALSSLMAGGGGAKPSNLGTGINLGGDTMPNLGIAGTNSYLLPTQQYAPGGIFRIQ